MIELVLSLLLLPPAASRGWRAESVPAPGPKVTRLVASADGRTLLVLARNGDAWRHDPADGSTEQILTGTDYAYVDGPQSIDRAAQDGALGLAEDPDGRIYVTVNTHVESASPDEHRVTIFRFTPDDAGGYGRQAWLTASYPAGVGAYGHGVADLAFGPDGMLYVGSGSRTDAGEAGDQPDRYRGGEVGLTACVWRLDPSLDAATADDVEVFARGLRNPFGLCFAADGRLLATENGPDENPPGELNVIEQGGHYGFPHRFSDWSRNPYRRAPRPPEGAEFTDPVVNDGPAGRGRFRRPLSTFTPHSSPVGIDRADALFGPDTFLVARFGDHIHGKPYNVGRDVLLVTLTGPGQDGRERMTCETFAEGFSMPIDVAVVGEAVFVAEYATGEMSKFTRE